MKFWIVIIFLPFTFGVFGQNNVVPENYPNLQLWLRSDSVDLNLAETHVTRMYDLSGNGNFAEQTDPPKMPLYNTSVVDINNFPSLTFDGSNDHLDGVGDFGAFTDYSLFFVVRINTRKSYNWVYRNTPIGNNFSFGISGQGDGRFRYWPQGTSNSVVVNPVVPNFEYHYYTLLSSNDSSTVTKYYYDGNQLGTTNNLVNTHTANGYTIGSLGDAVQNLDGEIVELILFDRHLSTQESFEIENYFRFRYFPPEYLPYIDIDSVIYEYGFCDTTLAVPNTYVNYLWSNGSTTNEATFSEPGTHWVEATNSYGYVDRDTFEIVFPEIPTTNDTIYCPSDSTTWYASLGSDYAYLWSNGSTADSLTIDSPGDYHVEITDTNGCVFQSDTLSFGPDPFESIVNLGPDQNLCSGNILTLQDGDSLAVDYLWSTGSTDSLIALSASDTYYVDVINANGCEASDTIDVTIIGDAPNVIIGLPTSVCEGEAFDFEDFSNTTDGSTITNWEWDMDDGTIINNQDGNHLYLNDNTYEVRLTVSTSAGCSASDLQEIDVIPKPEITFVTSNECQNSTIQFNGGQLSPTTISTWEWEFDDPSSGANNIASGQNSTHIFDSSGDFDVTLVGTDINGCSDTAIITKTILPTPIVDFNFNEVCEGNVVSFENLTTIEFPGLISSYNWTFGDGTSSGQVEPEKPYIASGNYTVNLFSTGNNGCTGQLSQNIKIHAIPIVDRVVESSCAGINTSFTDNSFVSDGSIAQVDWSIDNGAPISGFSVDEVFNQSGTISVEQTVVSAFGCTNSSTFSIDIEDYLNAGFDFSPNAFIAGSPISFISTSQGADSYEWTFESIGMSNQPDTTVIFPSSLIGETLEVELAIENVFGCRDSVMIELPVLERSTDLLIDELFLQESNDFYTVGVRLTNLGSTPINEVDLFLNSPSTPSIKETWEGSLQALETTIHIFQASPSSVVPFEDSAQNYVCVRGAIIQPDLFSESNLQNNEVCNLIEPSESVILSPQPNPIGDTYIIKVILSSIDKGTLKVYDEQGRVVDQIFENQNLQKGLNTFNVDASQYANGTYTLRYLSEQHSENVRIIKQ